MLAAWGSLGLHVGRLGSYPGHGLGVGLALDLISEALGDPLVPFWVSGEALDLMLEALGDVLSISKVYMYNYKSNNNTFKYKSYWLLQ